MYNFTGHSSSNGEEVRETAGTDVSTGLNSFFLSWTEYPELQWQESREELEEMHVVFMTDDQDRYIEKMFRMF